MKPADRDFKNHGRGSRLERIQKIMETANGIAVLTFADVRRNLLPRKEVDSTIDIPEMSRTDNVWSICFLFCITQAIILLARAGLRSYVVNIFYDPKGLKPQHWHAIQAAIRSNIVNACKECAPKIGCKIDDLCVVKIEEVAKPKRYGMQNLLQAGTTIADYLCSRFEEAQGSRIFLRDHTVVVTKTLEEGWRTDSRDRRS
jgi:hypothetical protein